MKQLSAPQSAPAEPEIVDTGLAFDPRVYRVVRLFESLGPRDRSAVTRHITGVTRLDLHDPDEELTTAAAARLLQVSAPIVSRLVRERRLFPLRASDGPYSHTFRYDDLLEFIEQNGTGRALHKSQFRGELIPPHVDWDRQAKHPLDYDGLLRECSFGAHEYVPLEETRPLLDEALSALPAAHLFVLTGRFRRVTYPRLSELFHLKPEALKRLFEEACRLLRQTAPGASLKLISDRFRRRHRCEFRGAGADLRCRHCSTHINESKTSLCPALPAPPRPTRVADLAAAEELRRFRLTLADAGLEQRLVGLLSRKGLTRVPETWLALDSHLRYFLRDQARAGRAPGDAYRRLCEFFASLGLVDRERLERLLAD